MTLIICPRTGFRCTSSGCAQPCEPVTQPAPAIPLGWQCPVCHVVLSPLIGRCDHQWPQMDLTPRAAA